MSHSDDKDVEKGAEREEEENVLGSRHVQVRTFDHPPFEIKPAELTSAGSNPNRKPGTTQIENAQRKQSGATDDDGKEIVDWDGPDDPDNP